MRAAGRMRHPPSFVHSRGMSFGRSCQVECVIALLYSCSSSLTRPAMKTTWILPRPLSHGRQECNVISSLLQPNQTQADRRSPTDPDLDPPWIRSKTYAPFAFSLRGWRGHATALDATAAHPARTSAVNVPGPLRFTPSNSPLNESTNHPMQPTSQTMLHVSDGKITLGYFRWTGGLRLYQFISSCPPFFQLNPGCEGLSPVFYLLFCRSLTVMLDRQPHWQSFKAVPAGSARFWQWFPPGVRIAGIFVQQWGSRL